MVNDTRAEYDRLQTLTDEELCALAQQGSRDAEEILVGRYHRLGTELSCNMDVYCKQ